MLCAPLLIGGEKTKSLPITLVGFGHRVLMPGMNGSGTYGDTWDATWSSNDDFYMQHNDGVGFGGQYEHDRICKLEGSPEKSNALIGTNLNPGILSDTFKGTPCYSTGLYEVDGVLYHNVCYSKQTPGAWVFHHTSIMKSIDGGKNWMNHLGQSNIMPPDSLENSFFSKEEWGQVNFIKYGRGGIAPNVDNAQTFVYLSAPNKDGLMLARIKRTELPKLDKTKLQFYKNGDGMLDENWSNEIANAVTVKSPWAWTGILYNEAKERYIMTSFSSDSWLKPPIESTLRILEAPHPWGPWSLVLDENVNFKEGDNLTWAYPMQKYTSIDGNKMWMSTSGRAPYGLQFVPVYLTTEPVQIIEAENAKLIGCVIEKEIKGFSDATYVSKFDTKGDECQFKSRIDTAGGYILNIRYNSNAYQIVGFYINNEKIRNLKFGKSEQKYAVWSNLSIMVWLDKGENLISFKCESNLTGSINFDKLSFALYSQKKESLSDDFFEESARRRPFENKVGLIPGTIEVENFDEGGEGIAYHDNDIINHDGVKRVDGVDIQSFGNGFVVGWLADGEWLEYTVDSEGGNYEIIIKATCMGDKSKLKILYDSKTLGILDIPNTGNWSSYQDAILKNISIPRGKNKILRLEIIKGGFNLDKLVFSKINN